MPGTRRPGSLDPANRASGTLPVRATNNLGIVRVAAPLPNGEVGTAGVVPAAYRRSYSVREVYLWTSAAYAALLVGATAAIPDVGRVAPVALSDSDGFATFPVLFAAALLPGLVYAAFATVFLQWTVHGILRCSSVPFHAHRALSLPLLFVLAAGCGGQLTEAEMAMLGCSALTVVYHGVVHDAACRCDGVEWASPRRSYRCVHQASVLVPLLGAGLALSRSGASDAVVAARVVLLTGEVVVALSLLSFVARARPDRDAFARLQLAITATSFLEHATSVLLVGVADARGARRV